MYNMVVKRNLVGKETNTVQRSVVPCELYLQYKCSHRLSQSQVSPSF